MDLSADDETEEQRRERRRKQRKGGSSGKEETPDDNARYDWLREAVKDKDKAQRELSTRRELLERRVKGIEDKTRLERQERRESRKGRHSRVELTIQ